MSSSTKMEVLYVKLYNKHTNLKKEKDMVMEKLNAEQEVKFLNYVAAATEMMEFLKSENDRLCKEVDKSRSEMASLRSAKDEELIRYQDLLMEEHLKNKELHEEIQRLQQLVQEGTSSHSSSDEEDNREMAIVRDSLPEPLAVSDTKATRKHSRQSTPSTQETVSPSTSKEPQTECAQPAWCRRNVDISGDGASNNCPGTCIFQELVQLIVGLKFSTTIENEELCISAFHESSGFSFRLRWIKDACNEGVLEYEALSLGTFHAMAPEWMKDKIWFTTTMCPAFFQKVSLVLTRSY